MKSKLTGDRHRVTGGRLPANAQRLGRKKKRKKQHHMKPPDTDSRHGRVASRMTADTVINKVFRVDYCSLFVRVPLETVTVSESWLTTVCQFAVLYLDTVHCGDVSLLRR